MKNFINEFKNFAMRGNVLDMAVGVMIGASFKTIIDSFITDIISPIIGIFLSDSLLNLAWIIGPLSLSYGAFISSIINFIITAFILFLFVKTSNAFKKKEEVIPPLKEEIELLKQIRDLLTREKIT